MSKVRITSTTALAVALSILLLGCTSSNTNEQLTQEPTTPQSTCSQDEIDGGAAWIKGQLAAFGKQDFQSAYGFASQSFQSARSLEEFVQIITANYGFLLDARSYSVGPCVKEGENYIFDVALTAASGEQYPMMYALEKTTDSWGINAATVVAEQGEEEPAAPIV